jgi:Protein of unknown function (DUF3307)
MNWTSRFADLLAAHAVGDFLLQTDWQAQNKRGGLAPDATSRQALARHVAVYTLACAPTVVGIARARGARVAAVAALGIALPHAILDDGRLLACWAYWGKRLEETEAPATVMLMVDQSVHLLCLWALARIVGDD